MPENPNLENDDEMENPLPPDDAPDHGHPEPEQDEDPAPPPEPENPGPNPENPLPPQPKKYKFAISPDLVLTQGNFTDAVVALEQSLGMPVWFLSQDESGSDSLDELGPAVFAGFAKAIAATPKDQKIAVLIDSPGGYSRPAYKLAMMLRRHCGGFVAVVPRMAKSAATLLALGADDIILGPTAELGPLDAQVHDIEREERVSALDTVQALERLHAAALNSLDSTMEFMRRRYRKRNAALLPVATQFVAEMMRPLYEKIDAVEYTQKSRVLKVAEAYAIRLLRTKYFGKAETMASELVATYPAHEFVIDEEELTRLGIQPQALTDEQIGIMEAITPFLGQITLLGRLQEVQA